MRMHPLWTEARAFWNVFGSLLPVLQTSRNNIELAMSRYLLPLDFVALVVMFMVWRLQRREWERACEALKQAAELKQLLER